jgi:hypothetical protein
MTLVRLSRSEGFTRAELVAGRPFNQINELVAAVFDPNTLLKHA